MTWENVYIPLKTNYYSITISIFMITFGHLEKDNEQKRVEYTVMFFHGLSHKTKKQHNQAQ